MSIFVFNLGPLLVLCWVPFGLPLGSARPALLHLKAPKTASGDPWLPRCPKTTQDYPQDAPKTGQDNSKTTLVYETAGGSFPSGASSDAIGAVLGSLEATAPIERSAGRINVGEGGEKSY